VQVNNNYKLPTILQVDIASRQELTKDFYSPAMTFEIAESYHLYKRARSLRADRYCINVNLRLKVKDLTGDDAKDKTRTTKEIMQRTEHRFKIRVRMILNLSKSRIIHNVNSVTLVYGNDQFRTNERTLALQLMLTDLETLFRMLTLGHEGHWSPVVG
jgi:hypothetical protein